MPKVLISDKLSQNAVDMFAVHGVGADVITGLSPEESQAIVGAYDGLAIRSTTKVTEAVLAAATKTECGSDRHITIGWVAGAGHGVYQYGQCRRVSIKQ